MALAYIPPGVTVEELTSSSLTPLLALPSSICLVGLAAGTITRTDAIILTSTNATVLPNVPTGSTMTSGSLQLVMDAINPSIAPAGFISGTDFTFAPSTYTLTRVVTSQTLSTSASAGAPTFSLSSGLVPNAGDVVRLTNGSTTETITVLSVSGQVVTATSNLINGYATSGTAVTWGTIPDGHLVYVTYTYSPADYYLPVRLTSMSDIQQRFGNAFDVTGTTINSPLSFAAGMAFQNGASNIVLQPLYYLNPSTGKRQQPNTTQAAAPSNWATTFTNLLDLQDINIIVPVVGQSQTNVTDAVQLQILEAAQDFVYQAKHGYNQYFETILAEDSSASASVAQEPILQAHAQTLIPRYGGDVTQQCVFLNTSNFSCANSVSSFLIGGQYVAAAVAGMLSARNPAATLTRQAVAGILAVTDIRTPLQKNTDAANGMMVLESVGSIVKVRHGVTMDFTSAATRELNVIRSKHFVIESIRATLEANVIGQVVADANAPTLVNNVVIGALETLRGTAVISDYSGVSSKILSLDPTAMAVRFSYRPRFIVNYVDVQFSLDLTSQTIVVGTTNSGTNA